MSESPVPADSADVEAQFAHADAIHDADPAQALATLRRLDATRLPAAQLARLAFLANHVAGEKFDRWEEALALQKTAVAAAGDAPTPTLLRHAATAARIAGDAVLARDWTQALAAAGQATPAAARALVTLGAVLFTASSQSAENAGRLALQALQPLALLRGGAAGTLGTGFAAVTNKLATHLLDRPLADLDQPDLRTALELTAEHSQRFWQHTGSWVELERAHYLRALAANALGDGAQAASQARAGLALLDANDAARDEDVDRGFLELELAQGLRLDGLPDASLAEERARALAAAFGESSLEAWFADRVRRNQALAAHYGRG